MVTALSNDLTTLVIGRLIQGIASGALLPVTLALAADLWSARNRAAVLGGIGNLRGALLGGIVLGLIENWGAIFLGSEWKDVIAFAVLVLDNATHEEEEYALDYAGVLALFEEVLGR